MEMAPESLTMLPDKENPKEAIVEVNQKDFGYITTNQGEKPLKAI